MIKGIYTAGRSLDHRIKNIDVIANNLANLNTTGFKREIPFSEIINEFGDVYTRKITSQQQGEILQTSNQLDLAISGKGFFLLRGEDGKVELTRDGRFKLNEEGYLVNYNNQKVMGKNGEISISETLLSKDPQILISRSGEIKVGDKVIDTIRIVQVSNEHELVRSGSSNFLPDENGYTDAKDDTYSISQGFLESANTNPIVEMEAMIQLNKEYETAQKVIAALDTSLGQANDIGKV